jgi:hypothetical protein
MGKMTARKLVTASLNTAHDCNPETQDIIHRTRVIERKIKKKTENPVSFRIITKSSKISWINIVTANQWFKYHTAVTIQHCQQAVWLMKRE